MSGPEVSRAPGTMGMRRVREVVSSRTAVAVAVAVTLLVSAGCSFDGVQNMSVPGVAGTQSGAYTLTATLPTAGNITVNAPVMMNDATVGSVGKLRVTTVPSDTAGRESWQAEVTLRLKQGVKVPAGSYARVGYTSVLGSMHVAIVPPEHERGGFLRAGDRLSAQDCPDQRRMTPPTSGGEPNVTVAQQVRKCTVPSTEQVLSSLSVVLNGGGLSQVGTIVDELNKVFAGRTGLLSELLPRAASMMAVLDDQRADIVTALDGINRLTGTFNAQQPTIEQALTDGPKILRMLNDERPELVDALAAVDKLSRTTNSVLKASSDDISTTLTELEKFIEQLVLSGPNFVNSFSYLTTFPFPAAQVPQFVRGDYLNGAIYLDLTFNRLSRNFAKTMTNPENVAGKQAGRARVDGDPFSGPLRNQNDPNQSAGSRRGPGQKTTGQKTTTQKTTTQKTSQKPSGTASTSRTTTAPTTKPVTGSATPTEGQR